MRLASVVLLAVLAVPAAARAEERSAREDLSREDLFAKLVERERGPKRRLQRVLPAPKNGFVAPVSTLDCVHARHEVELDPMSGVTSATLDLTLAAHGGPLASVGVSFDEGLSLGDVHADGRSVAITSTIVSPTRVVQIALSPPLADGEQTTVHVGYAGNLACGASPDDGAVLCTMGQTFSYFSHQSILPFLFDPLVPDDPMLDAMTHDIVLRVPSGTDVIATGERVSDVTEGTLHTSTWTVDRPLSRTLGMYIFAGKLGFLDVDGRSVPTTLVYPAPQAAVDQRLASWSAPVLDFVEKTSGTALPFKRSMTLVRLPSDVGDPGTATFGMTLLSERYERAGDVMHEETWSHENSHLFWGIVVPETNPRESRLMSEGIATLSELDYTWASHFGSEDRERYLARRFVPIGIDLRASHVPPVVTTSPLPDAYGTPEYTMWAYYQGAAVLDHLRATLGDDVFAKGLSAYVTRCSYVGCRPDDLRVVLESIAGKDLGAFWRRWVTTTTRPDVTIGFSPAGEVTLAKNDDDPMTLELWITHEDGARVSQRVDLVGRSTQVHVDGPVRAVQANPRHDVMVNAKSAVDGDLDFDGETDGLDLLRCTRLVGIAYKTKTGLGLWTTSESFDPRCDLDGDLRIDDQDLMLIAQKMGTLR